MAYSNWQGLQQGSYVVHSPTGEIKKFGRFGSDNVSFIDSFGIPVAYQYGNYSRNGLAKFFPTLYPKNKKGNTALENAISALPAEMNFLKQEEEANS